ncbi:MAG TPA: SGNH/GDSL hydrolase family protein [Planctomycetota bacterium]|nr:SGNH/GDSL hydrolase family protein [Planctomycetota bacterium]
MRRSHWKKLAVAAAAPLVFLALLEAGLAVAGVEAPRFEGLGDRDHYWLDWQAEGGPAGYDRAFRRKYKQFPEQLPLFLRDKPANGWRVFVLGESTVQGWPYETGCFADWMRVRATAMLPDRTVEVVNAGNAGWESSSLRLLLQECLAHEPDLIVWAVGHNEYTPYNMLSLRYETRHPVLAALRHAALKLRTTQFLGQLAPALERQRESSVDTLQSSELPAFGPEEPLIKQRFREMTAGAVEDAREAGVPIVLCTMPRNVRQWQPTYSFFSEATRADPGLRARWDEAYLGGLAALDAGDAAAALPQLEQARELDATPGKLHFALGRALEALGRDDAAREAYLQAVEQDGAPNRAHRWEEATIREVAAATRTPLVDLETLFNERATALGLAGGELISDNVHPNLMGHEVIAGAILAVLQSSVHVPFDRGRDVPPEAGRQLLGITEQETALLRKADCLNLTRLALQAGTVHTAWEKAYAGSMEVLATDPKDYEVMGALGCLEALAGHQTKARQLIERAIANNPFVKTRYVIQWKTEPPYQRAFAAAGVDMAAVEASLLPQQKQQVENNIFREHMR